MIGVVGAAGAVGRNAVAALQMHGHELRIGGPRPARLRALAECGSGVRIVAVDVFDQAGLAGFCRGCDIVVNCAGPAAEIGDRVARAAIAAGADYVDPAGDDDLLRRVANRCGGRRAAAISAGMMPGLTGLLPRHLAALSRGDPRVLTGYAGGRDLFTRAAATDFLGGAEVFGSAHTVLRAGGRVPASPAPSALPFFGEAATAIAFLSSETERVCAALGVGDASWYTVLAGNHTADAVRAGADPAAIARASELDAFGRRTYHLVVVELVTSLQTTTLLLRGRGASELTGAFTALTAHELARGRLPAGAYHAGEILDPARAIDDLRRCPGVVDIAIWDAPASELSALTEETV